MHLALRRSIRSIFSLAIPSLAISLNCAAAKVTVDYAVQDLGISTTTPMSMNNSGQMVGAGYLDPASNQWVQQAWMVTPGNGLTDLGIHAVWNSTAVGINDNGVILGRRWPDEGTAGFIYRSANGKVRDVPYPAEDLYAQLIALSPDTEIIGAVWGAGGNLMSRFTQRQVTITDHYIGTVNMGPCGESSGVAVNAAGQVAATVSWYAARIEADDTLTDLGAGYISRADAINRQGDVAGIDTYGKAFIYADGRLTWLPQPDWAARGYSVRAMNDKRQIVGGGGSINGCHAFVWSPRGAMVNLNETSGVAASGLHLEYAFGVDKRDRIAAQGINAAGQTRLVLLTPR